MSSNELSTHIDDRLTKSYGQLFKYVVVALCQSIYNLEDFLNFSNDLSLIHHFSVRYGPNMSLSKAAECLYTSPSLTHVTLI